jgi:hypothetical protein
MPVGAILGLGLLAFEGAMVRWLWPNCIRPALYYAGANATVLRTVPVIGIAAWLLLALAFVLQLGGAERIDLAVNVAGSALAFVYLAAYTFPRFVSAVTGGWDDRIALRRFYSSITQRAEGLGRSGKELERLRRDIVALDGYRNAETDEWIDLIQSELLDWTDGNHVSTDAARTRSDRIVELGTRLYPDTAPPTNTSAT